MAICHIIDDPSRTTEDYEVIAAHVRDSGPTPPDGCRLALLGRERAITVWDAPEDRDRFHSERLGPAYRAAGRSLDDVAHTEFDVEMLVAGDLVGKAQHRVGAES